jgi:hypothetical protein
MASPRGGVGGVQDLAVDITFPSILEHDVAAQVDAIVSGATLDGKPLAGTITRETLARLVLSTLGVENVDEELERLEDEWARMDQERAEEPTEARRLAEAIREFAERWVA